VTDAELTALWAEKVMGRRYEYPHSWDPSEDLHYYEPLTSLDDAMRGFEAHPEWYPTIDRDYIEHPNAEEDSLWICEIQNFRAVVLSSADHASLNRAIVIAQLRAVGVDL